MSACISVLTFNVLAPCYRSFEGAYESCFPDVFEVRHREIAFLLKETGADVVCLQEFWFAMYGDGKTLIDIYGTLLEDMYEFYPLKRTRWKKDGLLVLVKRHLVVRDIVNRPFNDSGNRVAMGLRILVPHMDVEIVLVVTHLTFPQGESVVAMRKVEAVKVVRLACEMASFAVGRSAVLLAGDWNGFDDVGMILQKADFEPTFGFSQGACPSVTHRNHLGECMYADEIFIRNAYDSAIYPHSSYLLPATLGPEEWHDEFNISDHRPLVTLFVERQAVSSIT